jgi:hypothetical protein
LDIVTADVEHDESEDEEANSHQIESPGISQRMMVTMPEDRSDQPIVV